MRIVCGMDGAEMELFFRRIVKGISNIIKWFPVIWNDRDWADTYLYVMLHKKIASMYEYLTDDELTDGIHHKNHIRKLLICKLLIERILDQGYLERALTPYRRKYGTTEIIREITDDRWIIFYGGKRGDLYSRCSEHSYFMEQQDYNMLHKILAKYSSYWWD